MSVSIAVVHGSFGRACLYALDRGMAPHTHREAHLTFHIDGPPASIVIEGRPVTLCPGQAVAVNPWQAHFYRPIDPSALTWALVFYIRSLSAEGGLGVERLAFGRPDLAMTPALAVHVQSLADAMRQRPLPLARLQGAFWALTQACYHRSWHAIEPDARAVLTGEPRDFRIRRALRLMQESGGEAPALIDVARQAGLSRPHFFKLFREQVGTTPALYLNTLRMDRAIGLLASTRRAIADIGLELGFSSQASFSHFFIANGVVAPSDYRRSLQVAEAAA